MIPLKKAYLFWDANLDEIDTEAHAPYIIERILAKGDKEDFHWLQKQYDQEKIVSVIIHNRTLDEKSLNFWCIFYQVDPTQCIHHHSRKQHGMFTNR